MGSHACSHDLPAHAHNTIDECTRVRCNQVILHPPGTQFDLAGSPSQWSSKQRAPIQCVAAVDRTNSTCRRWWDRTKTAGGVSSGCEQSLSGRSAASKACVAKGVHALPAHQLRHAQSDANCAERDADPSKNHHGGTAVKQPGPKASRNTQEHRHCRDGHCA